MIESTLMIIKPDGVRRKLIGEVISRIEKKGLEIAAMFMANLSPSVAKSLYTEHKGKDFYEPLIEFTISGPVVCMQVCGEQAVWIMRNMVGKTDCASPGTIRGDFALPPTRENVVHASAVGEARRELELVFGLQLSKSAS